MKNTLKKTLQTIVAMSTITLFGCHNYTLPDSISKPPLYCGDMNGDGKVDVLVISPYVNNTLQFVDGRNITMNSLGVMHYAKVEEVHPRLHMPTAYARELRAEVCDVDSDGTLDLRIARPDLGIGPCETYYGFLKNMK